MAQTKRIQWLDVLRCFGIYLIYIWHFRSGTGYIEEFAVTHFLPLFFLVSGATERLHPDPGILTTVKKTVTGILVPWLYYALASVVLQITVFMPTTGEMVESLLLVAKGTVRNQFFAHGLWFLTCLALTRILFAFLKFAKNKVLMVVICFGILYAKYDLFPDFFAFRETAPYNIGFVCEYLIFYAIGYGSFHWICRVLEPETRSGKRFLLFSGLISGGYTALLFIGKDILRYLPHFPLTGYVQTLLCPLMVVYFYCILAKHLENITILGEIGRNTLYLCGNEYIIKLLFPALLGAFGLNHQFQGPWYVYFYSMLLLIVDVRFMIPYEKRILKRISRYLPKWLFEKKQGTAT